MRRPAVRECDSNRKAHKIAPLCFRDEASRRLLFSRADLTAEALRGQRYVSPPMN